MQIDYFTIIAQILNFLVLIVLLRHFLYRPVIKSMDEREQKIASRLKEAEQKRKEAEEEAESQREMLQEISDKREEMLARAEEEVKAVRADLMKKAHAEVESSKADWYEAVERQREELQMELRQRAGKEVYAIARRALRDLADEDLERRIADAFIGRLQRLEPAEKERIRNFYKTPGQRITVRSSFELPEKSREGIQGALRAQAGTDLEVQFKLAPELIAGIEMSTQDLRIAWSITSYLDSLEVDLSRVLDGSATAEGQG